MARPDVNMARCKIETVETRIKMLMQKYMARNSDNPLFRTLVSEYMRGLKARKENRTTPLSFMKPGNQTINSGPEKEPKS